MRKAIIPVLAALALCLNASGQHRYGIVKYSADFMRTSPDYESGLETQALMGTPVEVIDSKGYWLKIKTPDPYTAWATDMGVVQTDSLQLQNYIASPKYICTSLWTEVYEEPDDGAQRISDLVAGDLLMTGAKNGNIGRHRTFLDVVLPDGRTGYVKSQDVMKFSSWAESRRATPENVVATAKRFLGTPYMWGGTSPKGLDCSGLTRTAFFLNGILLHRNASQQVKEGIEVPLDGFIPGKSEGNLKPGDLMFFGKRTEGGEKVTHVAMYIGGGRIIHSSHEVRVNSLNPAESDYYSGATRLLRARRMCDEKGAPYTSVRIIDSPYYFPQEQ